MILTDVVNGPGAEFAVELFGSEAPQVMDGVGPKVQHIVPGEGVPLLNHHHFGSHQSELDGGPQAAGTSSDDEALMKSEWQIDLRENELDHGDNLCHINNRRLDMKDDLHPTCLLT